VSLHAQEGAKITYAAFINTAPMHAVLQSPAAKQSAPEQRLEGFLRYVVRHSEDLFADLRRFSGAERRGEGIVSVHEVLLDAA